MSMRVPRLTVCTNRSNTCFQLATLLLCIFLTLNQLQCSVWENSFRLPGPVVKERYRAVILVLASQVSPLDEMFKRVWVAYMTTEPAIKVLFVYGSRNDSSIDHMSKMPYDLYYENIPDTYPVPIAKVLEAFKSIEHQYEYDFLVRTNLSTFWNLRALLEHLDSLPGKLCYAGDGPLPPSLPIEQRYYLSGTDTIVNRHMITAIVRHAAEYPAWASRLDPEDSMMGEFFHKTLGAGLTSAGPYFMEHYTTENLQEIHMDIRNAEQQNKTHFRVKTRGGDRLQLDTFIMKNLLRHHYDIDLEVDYLKRTVAEE